MRKTKMKFTSAAHDCIHEAGIDPEDDLDLLRSGEHTRESLLAYCLDGADADREQGWREYVDTVVAESLATGEAHLAAPKVRK